MDKKMTPSSRIEALENIRTKHSANDAGTQSKRLLEAMQSLGGISTIEANRYLDILHPPARKLNLIEAGHIVTLAWVYEASTRKLRHSLDSRMSPISSRSTTAAQTTILAPVRARTRMENPQINQTNYWRRNMANGWTAERRERQAEMIRTWKPWERSTGAKTAAGKARSSRNADKPGSFNRQMRELKREVKALVLQAKEIRQLARVV